MAGDFTFSQKQDLVLTFYQRLQDLKGGVSMKGLHANGMKNEYDALINFLKYAPVSVKSTYKRYAWTWSN